MTCKTCGSKEIRVSHLNEYFCPVCTKCPECGKNPATIHEVMGVMRCRSCRERVQTRYLNDKLGGWMSNQHLREHAATPFWKHMGLPPKPDEVKKEKYMKWKGMTYGDVQAARNSGKNARFDNSKLIKKALEGNLTDGHKTPGYWREGSTRK